MSEITYRGNLSASQFPLVSIYGGRSVIMPGPDQSYVRGLQVPQEGLIDENDKGIPQIIYCHNVMPSSQGFQSVGFITKTAAIAGNPLLDAIYREPFQAFTLGTSRYLALSKDTGNVYVLRQTAGVWAWSAAVVTAPAADITNTIAMTSCVINGQVYYLLRPEGASVIVDPCRQYSSFGNFFSPITLTGTASAFPLLSIKGNASAFGYHILWNEDTIAWSSLILVTDFVPSLITGAGFEKIQDARGQIVAVVKHQLGLIIYTTGNAVSAAYTGNPLRPFIFREITGVGGFPNYTSSGVSPQDLISDDSNTNSQYAYSSSGLQKIGMANINTVNTDITDFISGNLFEDFDEASRAFSQTKLASTTNLNKKLTVISDRYLVLSYGLTVLTHAIVLDIITKRIGKLKITHATAFALAPAESNALAGQERSQIAFMDSNGVISTVDFDTSSISQSGVLIVGKFQYSRQRLTQLQQVDLENTQPNGICACYTSSSLDGKNMYGSLTPGYTKANTTNLKSWAFHKTALNHTLFFIGGFYADSLLLKFNPAGRR